MPVFTILTRAAVDGILDIHDRMPVILPHDVSGERLSMTADVSGLIDKANERMVYQPVVPYAQQSMNLVDSNNKAK